MPIEIVLAGDEALQRRFGDLGRALPVAIMRAGNRALTGARAQLRRELRARGVQPKYLGSNVGRTSQRGGGVELVRFTPTNLAGVLRQRGSILPLIAYLPRTGFRSGKGIAGLATQIGERVPSSPRGGFYAQMPTGHRGVFRRAGRPSERNPTREAITEVYGPSLPTVIERFRLFAGLEPLVRDIFVRRLEHEAARLRAARGPSAGDADA